MESTLLSIIALVISLISAVISLWSAWTNHRVYSSNKQSRETDLRLMHTKNCSQLMEEIKTYNHEFESELEKINSLEPQFEKLRLDYPDDFSQYRDIFIKYKPQLEGFILQTRLLWHEAYEWSEKLQYEGYAAHSDQFRRLMDDDKKIKDEWRAEIEGLSLALERHRS